MSDQPWTLDGIAHALPFPELRQNFLRQVNLAPVERLPEITGRWIRLVEQHQAGRERAEAARAYLQEHGALPPECEPTPQSQAAFDAWRARMQAQLEQADAA